MSYLSSLKLYNFRCYRRAALKDLDPGFIVLHGPNGAGKTNVLEAVSCLVPGRGLRGARPVEIQCRDAGEPWAVAGAVQTPHGEVRLGVGIDPVTEKTLVRINGETAKSQTALGDYLACVWLAPQMDGIFQGPAGERRRFLDRLIYAFDPGHSGRLSRYQNAMSQRSKLLKEGKADPAWLQGLEAQMAETGAAISAARLDFIQRLQAACDQADSEIFPAARVQVKGTLEELLMNATALEAEDAFKYQLKESRGVDMLTGGAATGPHKSDLAVAYVAKNMPAAQCSTGEQKALLTGIVLAHAQLIKAERGSPPVLLFDEVAAHLDEFRRAALFDLLESLGGQIWLTGTEKDLFSALKARGQFFEIRDAEINC